LVSGDLILNGFFGGQLLLKQMVDEDALAMGG